MTTALMSGRNIISFYVVCFLVTSMRTIRQFKRRRPFRVFSTLSLLAIAVRTGRALLLPCAGSHADDKDHARSAQCIVELETIK